jgi:hypothetical protein
MFTRDDKTAACVLPIVGASAAVDGADDAWLHISANIA